MLILLLEDRYRQDRPVGDLRRPAHFSIAWNRMVRLKPICGNPNQGPGHSQACGKPVPHESTATYIKRVVGLPGDHIAIRNGHVIRNGTREKDSYIEPCRGAPECNLPQAITVPPGDYFMMGDNRGDSDDSRFWGPVPSNWIIGTAFFTYWPPSRIGFL